MAEVGKEAYAVFDSEEGSLTFFTDDEGKYTHGEVIGTKTYWTGIETTYYGWKLPQIRRLPPWSTVSSTNSLKIKTVNFLNEISPVSLGHWFNGCRELKEIRNIENLNTSNVVWMANVFSYTLLIKELDLSNFNTSKVETTEGMFAHCTNLQKIKVSDAWDMSNVTDSNSMFYGCQGLPNFDSSVVDVTRAYTGEKNGVKGYLTGTGYIYAKLDSKYVLTFFADDETLYEDGEIIDGTTYYRGVEETNYNSSNEPGWIIDTFGSEKSISEVVFKDFVTPISTYEWFMGGSFVSLDLTMLKTYKITNMAWMFAETPNLKTLDLSSFDTSNVTSMAYMFMNSGLKNLDLSIFDTSNVITMAYMFRYVTMETLDLSGFDTSNVTNMTSMFRNASIPSLDITNFTFNTNGDYSACFLNSNIPFINFPITGCFKGNWSAAFQQSALRQNIKVDNSPSTNTNIFASLTNAEIYIIWNGVGTNNWSTICQQYDNVHYEVDDVLMTANLDRTTRGIYDETTEEWTADEGEDEVRFYVNLNIANQNIPFDYIRVENSYPEIKFYEKTSSTIAYHIHPNEFTLIQNKFYLLNLANSYLQIKPEGNERPNRRGWYEENSGVYSLTTDTTVNPNKNYYYKIDPKSSHTYYVEITQAWQNENGNNQILYKTITTAPVKILGNFAIIDVMPPEDDKIPGVAIGKVAEEAGILDIGMPIKTNNSLIVHGHDTPIGNCVIQEVTSYSLISSGAIHASTCYVTLTPGVWIIDYYMSIDKSAVDGHARIRLGYLSENSTSYIAISRSERTQRMTTASTIPTAVGGTITTGFSENRTYTVFVWQSSNIDPVTADVRIVATRLV